LIAAVDVSLNLRWPTAVEMSGPWLRALAAGRPSVIVDLAHHVGLPVYDPRSWQVHGSDTSTAIAVAVDILDEDHSLRLALHRLAQDSGLRQRIGDSGRRYWEQTHTLGHMVTGYEDLLSAATSTAHTRPELPKGLLPDALAGTRDILCSTGQLPCVFD